MRADTAVAIDSGPLMVLAKLNLLHLLKELYGEVHIAKSVYDEVVVEGLHQGYDDAQTLKLFLEQTGWNPENNDLTSLPFELQEANIDLGERETLAVAIALDNCMVLMDEAVGREVARNLDLTVRGTLGLMLDAYRKGLISADHLRFCFMEASRRDDIWISKTLIERLMEEIFTEE